MPRVEAGGQSQIQLVEALADVCRAKGIARAVARNTVSGIEVSIEMGPPPAPSREEIAKMTPEQREEAEKAGRRAATAIKLRRVLGREPTPDEIEDWA